MFHRQETGNAGLLCLDEADPWWTESSLHRHERGNAWGRD